MGLRTRMGLVLALTGMAALLVVGCGGNSNASGKDAARATLESSPFRGGIVDPPFEKPAVVLTDTSGKPFDLKKETQGFITLFYVGYTHCPDICPTHMHDIAQVLKESDPAVAKRFKLVFVTADPDRDDPASLDKWIHFYNPNFIGLVPTKEQLSSLLDVMDMPPTVYTDIGGGNYTVSHAAYVVAFTEDNQGHLAYPFGFAIEDWRHDLNKLALVGWKEE